MALYVPKWVKYPKLLTLLATFALAYLLISSASFAPVREFLLSLGYIGTFLAGIMFAYGFTASIATAIFLILGKTQNIFLAAAVAGAGALLADLVIFRIVRYSFSDELQTLSREWAVSTIVSRIPHHALKYILPVLGCIIIASPLPDEIGVTMLAASTQISGKTFTIMSFTLNALGALLILWIGAGA